jgi:3-oxoacyl-ACP reductase-like protein
MDTFIAVSFLATAFYLLYFRPYISDRGANGNDWSTTSEDVIGGLDLNGQVAIVTGAGVGGIGFETAKHLANAGAFVRQRILRRR